MKGAVILLWFLLNSVCRRQMTLACIQFTRHAAENTMCMFSPAIAGSVHLTLDPGASFRQREASLVIFMCRGLTHARQELCLGDASPVLLFMSRLSDRAS